MDQFCCPGVGVKICTGALATWVSSGTKVKSQNFQESWWVFSCVWMEDSSHRLDSLWPSDAICWHRSRSTMAQVMACCLMAPIHYLNHCWLMINGVLQHSAETKFTGNAQDVKSICKINWSKLTHWHLGEITAILRMYFLKLILQIDILNTS